MKHIFALIVILLFFYSSVSAFAGKIIWKDLRVESSYSSSSDIINIKKEIKRLNLEGYYSSH